MVVDHTSARVTALPFVRVCRRRTGVSVWLRFCAALLLVSAGACATGPRKPPIGTLEPDKFLWERGTQELNARHWLTAREYFRQLIDTYPQSPYRFDAKLGMGDAFLGEASAESNLLAINEYREFLSFYPTHARAEYAQFKIGMAHFYEMSGPERDQTETEAAMLELSTFLQRFPNSSLAPEATTRLREARDRRSDASYRVGYFYFRTQKWYPGAIERFLDILKTDPQYTNRDAVYYYLAQSLQKVNRPAEALPYLDRLTTEFEQSEYLADAEKLAANLKAEMNKKAKTGSVPNVP